MANARIVGEATTPTGKPGILIECVCRTHPAGRTQAIMRAGAAAMPKGRIHGQVLLANHPALSRAPQIRANGPWKV